METLKKAQEELDTQKAETEDIPCAYYDVVKVY